ncbi:uncharacterized protein LOC128283938 [Gossypium arboreum]|uniref:uncharacterized protein LOC128283938 n=1 Tax=Gossypium arboreum TaxID=29729 RepID=UPI0022F1B7E6|nr:uncharacterized protein LOC128283938 [Gossypium arboreum]
MREPGHSIENCTTFKKLVERLINMGIVKFDDTPSAENPLPNHGDKGINAIIESSGKEIKMNVAEVNTPLKEVWKKMGERGLMAQNSGVKPREAKNYCEFHDQEDHEIQKCSQFRALVQGLMDNKELEFFEYVRNQEEADVCASEEGSTRSACEINHPLVIISRLRTNEDGTQVAPKVVIQKPVAFPYKNSKRVPWNYSCNVTIPGKKSPASASQENQDVGFFTRSGRRYVPEGTGTKIAKEKVPTVEQRKEKMVEFESPVNESVTENEAREFLKFLKHSEYSVVQQLHKQPARISVLALLLSSETHRSALMKVLNETYVAHDISVNKLDRLVNNISADNFIFFNDDEIPLGGMGSTKALHITTRCKGYTLPGVLIDNGSALNVLPLSTLNRLPVDSSHMKTCQNVVRAFDGTERNVMGRIELPLQIGPSTYEIDFLVMDIKPSYNCLLGRPWIHSAGAVPSSLHQKLKLITEGRLVTINAEEDIIASVTSNAPYVGTDDEAIEWSLAVERTWKKPTRKGQSTYAHGQADRFGLGFKPDARQKKEEQEKKARKEKSAFEREEVKWKPMTFPHISRTFVSGGTIYAEGRLAGQESTEEMRENFSINATFEGGTGEEDGTDSFVLCIFLSAQNRSPDINDVSDLAINSESPFERDMCLEGSEDFRDDSDCNLSPDLSRMVERKEKQILPHEETVNSAIIGGGA